MLIVTGIFVMLSSSFVDIAYSIWLKKSICFERIIFENVYCNLLVRTKCFVYIFSVYLFVHVANSKCFTGNISMVYKRLQSNYV